MEKFTFKDALIITIFGMIKREPDGSMILKGRNKIIYGIVNRLIGKKRSMDEYAAVLLGKIQNKYDIDDVLESTNK